MKVTDRCRRPRSRRRRSSGVGVGAIVLLMVWIQRVGPDTRDCTALHTIHTWPRPPMQSSDHYYYYSRMTMHVPIRETRHMPRANSYLLGLAPTPESAVSLVSKSSCYRVTSRRLSSS
eukprot:scaffold43944_cov59-Attheya_sp.AAC.12